MRNIGFASDASTVSEGATATLGLEFTGYTTPSDGVTLRFGVSSTAELTGSNTDATYDDGMIIPNMLPVSLTLADNANPSFSIDIAATERASKQTRPWSSPCGMTSCLRSDAWNHP